MSFLCGDFSFSINKGWILKATPEGDSLWMRSYKLLEGEDSENHLLNLSETSNKGLLAVGYVWPSSSDTGTQDAWVIKLDSIGCEYPLCDTTVGIVKHKFNEKDVLSVYPNPCNSYVTFKAEDCGRSSNGLKIVDFLKTSSSKQFGIESF